MTDSASPTSKSRIEWSKLGLPVVLVGFLSYFMIFAKYPITRDFPWVNLPIMVIGLGMAWRYRWRHRKARLARTRIFSSLLLTGCALIIALFCFYVFLYSYQLPKSGDSITLKEQPAAFTLKNHDGQDVNLSDYRGKHVILSFYRGYW